VENTNLLNNVFNHEKIEITEVNNRHMVIVMFLALVIMIMLFTIKKDHYYVNTITKVGDEYVLVVEKDKLNNILGKNKITINNKEMNFSINKKEVLEEVSFLYIKIENNIEIKQNSTYKIHLGKESLIEYIIRIVKN
jgi:predicted RND superfamily exporter protein